MDHCRVDFGLVHGRPRFPRSAAGRHFSRQIPPRAPSAYRFSIDERVDFGFLRRTSWTSLARALEHGDRHIHQFKSVPVDGHISDAGSQRRDATSARIPSDSLSRLPVRKLAHD